jgi:hypothetical protein
MGRPAQEQDGVERTGRERQREGGRERQEGERERSAGERRQERERKRERQREKGKGGVREAADLERVVFAHRKRQELSPRKQRWQEPVGRDRARLSGLSVCLSHSLNPPHLLYTPGSTIFSALPLSPPTVFSLSHFSLSPPFLVLYLCLKSGCPCFGKLTIRSRARLPQWI